MALQFLNAYHVREPGVRRRTRCRRGIGRHIWVMEGAAAYVFKGYFPHVQRAIAGYMGPQGVVLRYLCKGTSPHVPTGSMGRDVRAPEAAACRDAMRQHVSILCRYSGWEFASDWVLPQLLRAAMVECDPDRVNWLHEMISEPRFFHDVIRCGATRRKLMSLDHETVDQMLRVCGMRGFKALRMCPRLVVKMSSFWRGARSASHLVNLSRQVDVNEGSLRRHQRFVEMFIRAAEVCRELAQRRAHVERMPVTRKRRRMENDEGVGVE